MEIDDNLSSFLSHAFEPETQEINVDVECDLLSETPPSLPAYFEATNLRNLKRISPISVHHPKQKLFEKTRSKRIRKKPKLSPPLKTLRVTPQPCHDAISVQAAISTGEKNLHIIGLGSGIQRIEMECLSRIYDGIMRGHISNRELVLNKLGMRSQLRSQGASPE